MTNEEKRFFKLDDDVNFTLFNLKIRATTIKNDYLLKDSMNSLINFINTNNLRTSNP